ncbi:hypothetical protein GCM10027019_29570 [Melaminivora jejuensis]
MEQALRCLLAATLTPTLSRQRERESGASGIVPAAPRSLPPWGRAGVGASDGCLLDMVRQNQPAPIPAFPQRGKEWEKSE